ncbi:hypothetical protein PWT90_06540 [Aphanocladium album]|nr:hypothetical protein PWT90_06540 [Aphanocladium album]
MAELPPPPNQDPFAAGEPDMNEPYLAICPPAPTLRVPPRETLTDGTVTVRRWRADDADADALFRIITASRARLAEWMPWAKKETYERAEAERFTRGTVQRFDSEAGGWDYAITVGEHEDEAIVVGSCGLSRRDDNPGVDAGYWLAEGHIGKGYATRAVKLLTDEALGGMHAPSVRILHDSANARSRAVAERLGYECQGDVEADDNPEGRPDTVWIKYP